MEMESITCRSWLKLSMFMTLILATSAGNFYQDVETYFGDQRAEISEGGRQMSLSLDKISGSGFRSKKEYLFGRFDMLMKLVPDNSAGTVTTFYLTSLGQGHDEIDFEFLGNASGQPYTVHTNVYSQGKGDKEQQFKLWFDPTTAFHKYTIVWNSQRIIFMVDDKPIRVHNNHESIGVPFPKSQPMRVYCSLWNADDWATQGGLVKTDWTKAPFTAYYRNFNVKGNECVPGAPCGSGTKSADSVHTNREWENQGLDGHGRNRIRWVQQNHMIYNYCSDRKRFGQNVPVECKRPRF